MTYPWSRQHREPSSTYTYFQSYLEFGEGIRSIKLVSELHGKSDRFMESLSSKFGWVSRARAWDVHCSELQRLETEKQIQKQAAEDAKKLARVSRHITGSHLSAYGQARRRLDRLREREKEAIATGDMKKLPREDEWKSVESSLIKMLRLGEQAEARMRSQLLGSQDQTSQSVQDAQVLMEPHIAAAVLAGVSSASGVQGPDMPGDLA